MRRSKAQSGEAEEGAAGAMHDKASVTYWPFSVSVESRPTANWLIIMQLEEVVN